MNRMRKWVLENWVLAVFLTFVAGYASGCGTIKGSLTLAEGIGNDLAGLSRYAKDNIKENKNENNPNAHGNWDWRRDSMGDRNVHSKNSK